MAHRYGWPPGASAVLIRAILGQLTDPPAREGRPSERLRRELERLRRAGSRRDPGRLVPHSNRPEALAATDAMLFRPHRETTARATTQVISAYTIAAAPAEPTATGT
jgi:hypothetical protein